jgi:hypothetical protein
MLTTGGVVIGMLVEPVLEQEPTVTVMPSTTLPLGPAVKEMLLVEELLVIVPLEIVQAYVAPAWIGVEALLPVELAQTAKGARIAAPGFDETVTVCVSVPLQPDPFVTVTL